MSRGETVMDDWQKTVGTREELLEALHRERERREAAERERDKMTDERNECRSTLERLRHSDTRVIHREGREGGLRYELRQALNMAMRCLRDAEDIARLHMTAFPTADRIRFIHEQLTEDVLTGKTTRPSRGDLEATLARVREVLEHPDDFDDPWHEIALRLDREGEK